MLRSTAVMFVLLNACVAAFPQNTPCVDIADEPNHRMIFENGNIRIFRLDFPGQKTTDVFCVSHPYVRIVATEGRVSDLQSGGPAAVAHDWKAGEARFVFQSQPKAVRNERGTAFREYDIEALKPFEYNPLAGNDSDLFVSGPPGLQPTETITVVRGPLVLSSNTLAPNDVLLVGGGEHFLVALSDVELSSPHQKVTVSATEAARLSPTEPMELKNVGTAQARFILVQF